jgi:hypothetical protein
LAADLELSAAELFQAVVRRWWDAVGEKPIGGIPKLIIAEARNFPEIARFYAEEVIERGKRLLVTVLRRGIDSGEFRPFDPEVLVHIVFAPLMMRLVWKHSLDFCGVGSVPVGTFLERYTELMLRGLRSETS